MIVKLMVIEMGVIARSTILARTAIGGRLRL